MAGFGENPIIDRVPFCVGQFLRGYLYKMVLHNNETREAYRFSGIDYDASYLIKKGEEGGGNPEAHLSKNERIGMLPPWMRDYDKRNPLPSEKIKPDNSGFAKPGL